MSTLTTVHARVSDWPPCEVVSRYSVVKNIGCTAVVLSTYHPVTIRVKELDYNEIHAPSHAKDRGLDSIPEIVTQYCIRLSKKHALCRLLSFHK